MPNGLCTRRVLCLVLLGALPSTPLRATSTAEREADGRVPAIRSIQSVTVIPDLQTVPVGRRVQFIADFGSSGRSAVSLAICRFDRASGDWRPWRGSDVVVPLGEASWLPTQVGVFRVAVLASESGTALDVREFLVVEPAGHPGVVWWLIFGAFILCLIAAGAALGRSTPRLVRGVLRERAAVALLAGGAALRLVTYQTMRGHALSGDAISYNDYAVFFYHLIFNGVDVGGYYPYYPPGLPLWLSLVYGLTGPDWRVAVLFNLPLDLLLVWLAYRIGVRIFSREVGTIGLAVLAVYPTKLNLLPLLFPENLFSPVFYLGLYFVVTWKPEEVNSRRAFGLGGLLGIATLIRPFVILFPAVVILYWFAGFRQRVTNPVLTAVRRGSAVAAGMCLVLLPNTVFSSSVAGHLVPVSEHGGITLWHGNNPKATGGFVPELDYDNPFVGLNTFQRDRLAYRLGFQFIVENPWRFVRMIPAKIRFMYWDDYNQVKWMRRPLTGFDRLWDGPSELFHRGIVMLFLLGFFWTLWDKRNLQLMLLHGTVVYWTSMAVVFVGQPKYFVPLHEVVALLAAWTLVHLASLVAARCRRRSSQSDGAER